MAYRGLNTTTVVKQFTAALTAALTMVCCGCWMSWPSSSIPQLKNKSAGIVMSSEEVSWMVAAIDLGNLVSPLPSGYCMNNFGRKKTLMCAGLLYLLSWIFTVIAYNSWYLYVARFLAGLGKGITFTTLPIYLGEISSVPIRGALSSLMIVVEYVGIIFSSIVGPILSFKVFAGLLAVFPLIFLIIFPFMPESPYYLVMKGHEEDALKAFQWLRGTCVKTDCEFEGIKECVDEDMKIRGRFVDLVLHKGNRRALGITLVIIVLHRCMGGTSLLAYTSTTLPSHGHWFGPSEAVVLYTCVGFFSSILVSGLVDLWGRRPIILISSLGVGISHGLSAIFYYLYWKTKVNMNELLWIPYFSFIFTGIIRLGIACVIETLQGELFPTNLRGHATAVCTVIIAITTFLIDKLYVTVNVNVGVYATFFFYCASSILCGVFIMLFLFETKGKTLMEIQKMM